MKGVNMYNKKSVGILGGMGPYATAMFFQNILELTPAGKDWEHIRIIVDNNPQIPSRSRAILFGEESPVKKMTESCKRLEAYPVDFISVPCNSACYFLPEVQKYIKTPLLNIINIASEEMYIKYPEVKKVSVLGGIVTYLKETYKESLQKRGIQLIKHDEETQRLVSELIEKVKLNKSRSLLKRFFFEIIKRIKSYNVDGVILACTEFTLFKNIDIGIPMIDSGNALAEYTVQVVLGNRPIHLDTEEIYEFWKRRARKIIEGEVSEYQSTLLTKDIESSKERDIFEKKKLLECRKKFKDYFKGIAIDFGCGVGRLTELFSKYFKHIDAIDYCEEFINIAKENARKKNINNINYLIGKVEEFNSNKKYDCAITAGLIIFLDDKQFLRLVEIIAQKLKTGGICLIRESMGHSKRFELHGFYSKVIESNYHAIYRSSDEIVNEFKKYGFILKYEEMTLLPSVEKPETCQKIIVLKKQ